MEGKRSLLEKNNNWMNNSVHNRISLEIIAAAKVALALTIRNHGDPPGRKLFYLKCMNQLHRFNNPATPSNQSLLPDHTAVDPPKRYREQCGRTRLAGRAFVLVVKDQGSKQKWLSLILHADGCK